MNTLPAHLEIGDRVIFMPTSPLIAHLAGPGTVESTYVMRQLVPRIPMTVTVHGPDNVIHVEYRFRVRLDSGAAVDLHEGGGDYTRCESVPAEYPRPENGDGADPVESAL